MIQNCFLKIKICDKSPQFNSIRAPGPLAVPIPPGGCGTPPGVSDCRGISLQYLERTDQTPANGDTMNWRTDGRGPRPTAAIVLIAVLTTLAHGGCQVHRTDDHRGPATDRSAAFPMSFGFGVFDERFGITRKEFLAAATEAKEVWEKAAGRTLFRFAEGSTFTLNLVFDERQERTFEARKVKAAIDAGGRSYDALVWQHDRRVERMKESEERYATVALALRKRLDDHNAEVTAWNERGGAPPAEYARLERELAGIREGEKDLERMKADLDDDVSAVNDLVVQINRLAADNNIQVDYFNGKFVESREFEQGVFDGSSITIYQFSTTPELRIALIHEFGHALGFGHVDEPGAIMYYRMGRQDLENPTLAPADLELLAGKFGGD